VKAQDGKVYKNIITNEILGDELWLGCNDKKENYIEVDKPIVPIEPEPIEPPAIPAETEKTIDEQIEEIQTKIRMILS